MTTHFTRRRVLKWGAGALIGTLPWMTRASDDFIRIVVPFPAGGSADLVARALAPALSQRLATQIWVENRPGADGAIAAAHVASAAPDGKTLLMATYGAISALPHMKQNLSYRPETDLTPVAHMGQFSMMLFGSTQSGLHNFKEFQAHCQNNPQSFNCGTGNVASIVMSSWLGHHWHVNLNQISYKGEVPAMMDLVTDRIQMMFATPTNALNFVRQGKLLALAHVGHERHRMAPETPSWLELGLQPLAAQAWGGIMAPAGTPDSIIRRYHQATNDCFRKEIQMVEDMQFNGFDPHTSSLTQLPSWIRLQSLAWQQAILDSGIRKV